MSGKSGYQLNPGLTVDDQTHQASRKTKEELGESPADRQEWILAELQSGRRLRRKDLEKQFGISTATAKRDFTLLDDRVASPAPERQGIMCSLHDSTPAPRAIESSDVPEGLESGENAGDLIGAFLVLPAEAGGEDFGVLADGWQEFADGGDLGG